MVLYRKEALLHLHVFSTGRRVYCPFPRHCPLLVVYLTKHNYSLRHCCAIAHKFNRCTVNTPDRLALQQTQYHQKIFIGVGHLSVSTTHCNWGSPQRECQNVNYDKN